MFGEGGVSRTQTRDEHDSGIRTDPGWNYELSNESESSDRVRQPHFFSDCRRGRGLKRRSKARY